MSTVLEHVQGLAAGIMAGQNPESTMGDLIFCLRAETVQNMKLSDEDYRELTKCIIVQGFDGNAESFIKELHEAVASKPPIGNEQMNMVRQALGAAIDFIYSDIVHQSKHRGTETLDAVLIARGMIAENSGRTKQILRFCARSLGTKTADGYTESYVKKMGDESQDSALDALTEGIIATVGARNVWLVARKLILNKNPEGTEAEEVRLQRIEVLKAKLEVLLDLPINIRDPSANIIKKRREALFAELCEIDETATEWFKKIAPGDKIGSW